MGFRVMQVQSFQARLKGGCFPRAGNLNVGRIAAKASTSSRNVHRSVHSNTAPYRNLLATTARSATAAVFSRVGFQADNIDTKCTLASLRPRRYYSPGSARRWSSNCYNTAVECASINSARRPTVRDSTNRLQLWTQLVPPLAGPVQCVTRSNRRVFSSSSDDTSSKKPESAIEEGEEKVDLPPTAEAEIIERKELKHELPRHVCIEMPAITDEEKVGTLTSWNVKVGDAIEAGDVVCEIELEQFSVGVKVETTGFLAEILVEAGTENVPVGERIGTVVHSEEDIALYLEAKEPRAPVRGEDDVSSASETFSWKDVLKATLRLRQEEKFSEDNASTLMSLARNKDPDLLQAFEGCFEGDDYKGDIDDELFVIQARDIAKTRRKRALEADSDGASEEQNTEPQK